MRKNLVSIITPMYNSEKFIEATIKSVINQTYKDWEMIIVDDCSTDNSPNIVKPYVEKDSRIKYIRVEFNQGVSHARNVALKEASGQFIAFLDSDDIWKKNKLKKQVEFMEKNDYYFSYTDYEYIDEDGKRINIYRNCPKKVSYFNMLLGDSIGCLTVMYNAEKVGKLQIQKLDKRNDYALWCLALKKVKRGYKLDEILSKYRVSNSQQSLSSGKKKKLLKYHYQMHKQVNGFNSIVSLFFTMTNVVNYIFNKKVRDKKI